MAIDVKDVTKMTPQEVREEAERQNLTQMLLQTDRLKLQNQQDLSQARATERKKLEMQNQLRGQAQNKLAMRKLCNHRVGNTVKNRLKGNGTTALKIVKMPDGFTTKVHCMNCPAEWWSPMPTNQSPKPKMLKNEGRLETKAEVQARIEKYLADKAEFDAILEMAQDNLSEEQSTPMSPGVIMRVTDADGLPVYRERPCDSYATGAHVAQRAA